VRIYLQVGKLTDAGLKEVRVERTAERPAFGSGQEMWDWVLYGNPIPAMLVADLTAEQQTATSLERKGACLRRFCKPPEALDRRPLLTMRSDRQPLATHGNRFGLVSAVFAAAPFAPVATGCDRSAP
jgi:hypothetical protein